MIHQIYPPSSTQLTKPCVLLSVSSKEMSGEDSAFVFCHVSWLALSRDDGGASRLEGWGGNPINSPPSLIVCEVND